MSKTIRKTPITSYRKVRVKNNIIINSKAVDMIEDEGFIAQSRAKVKGNYSYASDDFINGVWDQIPKHKWIDLRDE
jgi:hypothetical protein